MNNMLKFQYNFFKYYSKTKCFISLILLTLIFNFFFAYMDTYGFTSSVGYSELAISIIGSRIPAFINILLFTFNSIYLYKIISNNDLFILRERDRRSYDKKVIETIICQNLFLFFLNIMFLLVSLNILTKPFFGVYYLQSKGTYNIIYFFFFLIRYFSFLQIFPLLLILLIRYINEKVGFLIFIFYILYLFLGEMVVPIDILITSINDIAFKLSYFILNINYSSFIFEFVISLFYILLLSSIMLLLFSNGYKFSNFTNKYLSRMKKKYYLYKIDIKWYLRVIGAIIVLSLLINYSSSKPIIEKFLISIGMIERDNITVLEMLIVVLYSILPIYFALNKFIKNMDYQVSSIFLREKYSKFVISNLLSYFLVVSCLRIILYVFTIVLYVIVFNMHIDYISLSINLINDFFNFTAIAAISFLTFIIFYSFDENDKIKKIIFYVLDFSIIALFFNYYKLEFIKFLSIIIPLLLTYVLFTKNGIKIFEKLYGGK